MNGIWVNLKEYVLDWLGPDRVQAGIVEMAACGSEVIMVKLAGACLTLGRKLPDREHHVSMLMTRGELRLTLNGDRVGLFAPAYIDFIASNQWKNVTVEGNLEGYLLVVERNFFLETTSKLRSRISEKMMAYAKRPFVSLNSEEVVGLQGLSSSLFALMSAEKNGIFHRELVQSMLRACQCELWNIVFRQGESVEKAEEPYRLGEMVAHFLYLAHTYCCERHEVNWYCEQLGVSPNALTATLKRFYGKTARSIIDDLLITEAKVALRNPELSVQDISDKLCFSDQSAFGKFFKRYCGMSPALFRREQEKEK